jgi:anion-transporting  ArsA/GET3 family ATPase
MKTKPQVILVVGTGGVGKTTTASVLAISHSLQGKKTLVITIDPARRLMDALGIKSMKPHLNPMKVDTEALGLGPSKGELYAFMPDLRREWLSFLTSSMPKDQHKAVRENPFFDYVADGMPGSLEIICSHILFRFINNSDFDVVVLDTPPASQSITFFDVPRKIEAVLLHPLFRKLTSGRGGKAFMGITRKLAFFSSSILENSIERLVGSHFLSELINFALAVESLYEPMIIRTRAMAAMLTDETTILYLVARPTGASVKDSVHLKQALQERGIVIDRLIINQVLKPLAVDESVWNSMPMASELLRLKEREDREHQIEIKLIAQLSREFALKPLVLTAQPLSVSGQDLLPRLVADFLHAEGKK